VRTAPTASLEGAREGRIRARDRRTHFDDVRGAPSAAAAVGVGARASATKSAIVTSDLVPDRGHDRHARRDDRAGDDLLVERPEILERTATPPDHEPRRAS
jgi:hypothetical protein